MIDRVFDSFDKLATSKDICRVETTGDAWMGVSNCARDQSSDHTKRLAEFALAAVNAVGRILIDPENLELGFVQICVGFHAGPVLSNVIGSHTRRYALFGDTVNVAARIASTSKPGFVLCSESANSLLREQAPGIETYCRDRDQVTGEDNMATYWVCEKGHRATAALERVRQKQQLRLLQSTQERKRLQDDAAPKASAKKKPIREKARVEYAPAPLGVTFATDEVAAVAQTKDEYADLEGNLMTRLSRTERTNL
jgi:hypothetical protein